MAKKKETAKKKKALFVKLLSEKSHYIYNVLKNNARVNKTPLSFRKYDPVLREHCIFTETKKKSKSKKK